MIASRPLRIGLVTHVVVPWDGQGRVVSELARYLARAGHRVTLVASEVAPDLRAEPGVDWMPVPVPAGLPDPVRWGLFAWTVRTRLKPAVRRGFDVIHLNGAVAPIPADVNTCHFVHAAWADRAQVAWRGPATAAYQDAVTTVCAATEVRAYRSAGRVVAVSDAVADDLSRLVGVPGERIRVIHTGVDALAFRPAEPGEPVWLRIELGLPVDAFLALFVGDAKSPRKNLDLALDALARLGPRFHLVVLGDPRGGPYPALASRLGLGQRVHFVGARPDPVPWLRAADVLVCPSHYEPASLALLEAMATALPVIASPRVGNAAFIMNGRNGFVLRSPLDLEGLAAALTLLADGPDLRRRMGRAARETAEVLSWTQMGRQYEGLYGDLLDRGPSPRAVAPAPRAIVAGAGS